MAMLSEFIRTNHEAIVGEWESFARTFMPDMTGEDLRDHAGEILSAIEADLEVPQGSDEQTEKSKGHGEEHRMEVVGRKHAALRIEGGFTLSQMVAEYRALRASVLKLYARSGDEQRTCDEDLQQVTRFNEALDEALMESTDRYMLVMDRTRDQFIAILGHDLRNPLGAILMSAALLTAALGSVDKNAKVAARISRSAERMKRMLDDLLDLTRTRLGPGIPISPKPMDLEVVARETVAELEAFHPDRVLQFQATGALRGTWDPDRLAQVVSNLVANALQHGGKDSAIQVRAGVEGEAVVIKVHNSGDLIARTMLASIFEPMVRKAVSGREDTKSTSLGLGLHIAREVVLSHQGTLSVTSTEAEGTTFTVRLPRHSKARPDSTKTAQPQDLHNWSGESVAPSESLELLLPG